MLKKLLKLSKIVIVGLVWTYIYVYLTELLTIGIWRFNYLSLDDWRLIGSFWEKGGSIKKFTDYMLFITLFLLIPVWLLGWRYFYRKSFLRVFLAPIVWYNKRIISRYGSDSPRVILKNMGTSKKITPEEFLEKRLEPAKQMLKEQKPMAQEIRERLKEKISSTSDKQ